MQYGFNSYESRRAIANSGTERVAFWWKFQSDSGLTGAVNASEAELRDGLSSLARSRTSGSDSFRFCAQRV